MRLTITLSTADRRGQAARVVSRAPKGTRVTFDDPESTEPQQVKLKFMFEELSRKAMWHGWRLDAEDWRCLFLAELRHSQVIDGLEPGTRLVLFERKSDEPSNVEASGLIDSVYAFCAEQGITIS